MPCQVVAESWSQTVADWLIVGVLETATWDGALAALDHALQGQLTRLQELGDLTGKAGESVVVRSPVGIAAKRLLLIGLGKPEAVTTASLNRAYSIAGRQITSKPQQTVAVGLPAIPQPDPGETARLITTALLVAGQGQDLYRTEKLRFPLADIRILAGQAGEVAAISAAVNTGEILGHALNLARELVNEPADVIYPETFAVRAQQVAAECGITCRVLDEKQLEAERMGSLLAVAKGSDRPARVVVLEYNKAPAGAPVLTFVGKGVTFDSGGLSLKPTDGMLTMKCDMAGAATVLAAVSAIAQLKLPVHVRGYMGLVENMTGGKAMKLGDVLTSRAGVTIEVLNTDAEGRLVLADVLDYAVSEGADYLIDLATLTGACVVALGEEVVGAFTNEQNWCNQLLQAASATGEDVWQLPMYDHYNELIKGDIGDIKNTGGRWGGAITAAKFLERFVAGKPWVHLDIAGPAYAAANKPHREAGGTGVMVRTLIELARRFPS